MSETSPLPTLPAGWVYRELNELLVPNGISYGIVQPGNEVPGGIPIVRVKNVRRGQVLTDDVMRVSPEIENSYARTRLSGGEVLLSLVGSVGEVAVAPPELAGWNVARAIAVMKVASHVTGQWIMLCLTTDLARQHMGMWQNTTVQATLNLSDVRRLPIIVPPKAERDAIMSVLGALDDKIAVNERIADTARQLASALYVDACAARSVIMSIDEFSSYLNRGQSPKYSDGNGILVINQKCVRGGRISLGPSRTTQASRVQGDRKLRLGDVLVNSTGVGTLGRVGIWSHDLDATVDSHVTIVRINPAVVQPVIGGFALLAAQPEIESMGEGSTGQTELSRAKLGAVKVRVPDIDRNELAARLSALEQSAEAVLQEVLSLAALRDTLLPKLMSGQITVKQAESVVEDVA